MRRCKFSPLSIKRGGVAKTTTAINLAGALVSRGERVLVVDLDPQAHATMGLGVDGGEGTTVAEVLLEEAYIEQSIRELESGLHLLPAKPRLAEFEERSERLMNPEQRLRIALDAVRDRYDYVVVDCPPRADGVLCANALFACTTAILVVETGAFALQGALQAIKVLAEVGENQDREYDLKVVGTLFDRRTKFCSQAIDGFACTIRGEHVQHGDTHQCALARSPALGVTVDVLDPQSRATADFKALAEEVCNMGTAQEPAASPDPLVASMEGPSPTGTPAAEPDPMILQPRAQQSPKPKVQTNGAAPARIPQVDEVLRAPLRIQERQLNRNIPARAPPTTSPSSAKSMDTLALLCTLHADGPATLGRLRRAGCQSLSDLQAMQPDSLAELLQVPPAMARRLTREARLLHTGTTDLELDEEEAPDGMVVTQGENPGGDSTGASNLGGRGSTIDRFWPWHVRRWKLPKPRKKPPASLGVAMFPRPTPRSFPYPRPRDRNDPGGVPRAGSCATAAGVCEPQAPARCRVDRSRGRLGSGCGQRFGGCSSDHAQGAGGGRSRSLGPVPRESTFHASAACNSSPDVRKLRPG